MSWMTADYEAGLVSVIVPTYNRADLIGESLDSVRQQIYRPIEILVVDDGSTDGTQQVVREFTEATAGELRVRYVRQENQGAQVARNRGLIESRGEFIQFLDSDDMLHREKLSAQVSAMREEPRLQYVFSAWEYLDQIGTATLGWRHEDFSPDRENLLALMLGADPRQSLPLCTANGLYRRSLCVRIGPWDTEQRCLQPRLYNLHVLLLGAPYRYLPAVHAWVRLHEGDRITAHFVEPAYVANMRGTWRKMRRLLQEAGLLGRRYRCLLGGVYYALARDAFMGGDAPLGLDLLKEGISLTPPSAALLKLLVTGLLYRMLGAARANRLFNRARALRGCLSVIRRNRDLARRESGKH